MSATVQKFATYEDLFDLPEHIVGEIIHGQLITHPRPAPKHALASSSLGGELVGPFQKGRSDGPGGWWILDEPELHLGPQILVPDLAGWRRVRLPVMPETAYFILAPDWICEVLSPGTARVDRADKMPLYAEYGVRFLWLIDPAPRALEAFLLSEGRWMLEHVYKDDDEARAAPFDALSFPLADLWS
jgi:Uma2 family endonuclease